MPRVRAHILIAGIWVAVAVALVVLTVWAAISPSPDDGLIWVTLLWGVIGFFPQHDFRKHRDHSSKPKSEAPPGGFGPDDRVSDDCGIDFPARHTWEEQPWPSEFLILLGWDRMEVVGSSNEPASPRLDQLASRPSFSASSMARWSRSFWSAYAPAKVTIARSNASLVPRYPAIEMRSPERAWARASVQPHISA